MPGDGAAVEQAIERLRAALAARTRQDFPAPWADTQTALGRAYVYGVSEKLSPHALQGLKP